MVDSIMINNVVIDIHCERCNSFLHKRYLPQYLQINYDVTYCMVRGCGIVPHKIGSISGITKDVITWLTQSPNPIGITGYVRDLRYENLHNIQLFLRNRGNVNIVEADSIYREEIQELPFVIKDINNPSLELQLLAVQLDSGVLKYILKPYPEVIQCVRNKKYTDLQQVFQDVEQW